MGLHKMKVTAAITMGLIATASGASLRSHHSLSKQRTAMPLSIQALAEKYDCATGERGLEVVIKEIIQKNGKEQRSLDSSCKSSLAGYQNDFDTTNKAVLKQRTDAKPNAKKKRNAAIKQVTDTHAILVNKHKDLVDVATTAQNDADAAHTAQKATYKQQKDEYERAQKRHAKDVEEAKLTYETATDHAAEDQIEANKFADKNKSDADKTTEKMNDARQDIISSDTEILKQLKEFQGELSNICATDATIQTKFLQVSANYNQMVTEKADETTKWKKSHRDTLEGFDDTLARLETDAEAIRTSTGPKHKKIYEDEKSLIDKVVEDLKQSHSNIVDPLEKTETTLKDTNAKAQKKETSTTNTYNSMKAVVSTL